MFVPPNGSYVNTTAQAAGNSSLYTYLASFSGNEVGADNARDALPTAVDIGVAGFACDPTNFSYPVNTSECTLTLRIIGAGGRGPCLRPLDWILSTSTSLDRLCSTLLNLMFGALRFAGRLPGPPRGSLLPRPCVSAECPLERPSGLPVSRSLQPMCCARAACPWPPLRPSLCALASR